MTTYTDDRGFLTLSEGQTLRLPGGHGLPPAWHVFTEAQVLALNAALAARRPLLLRGEPGTGKSQLARAAAVATGRCFVHQVVDARTETRDLLWNLDVVARLAEAQVIGAQGGAVEVKTELAVCKFVQPGALWWALAPRRAHEQAQLGGEGLCVCDRRGVEQGFKAGSVVLIDEIDKADPSVPNALLDALGQGGFNAPGVERVSAEHAEVAPLILITTNNERALPAAFLRRCLVLNLALPTQREALLAYLARIGRVHFEAAPERVLTRAAELLVEDREAARRRHLSLPGLAEYLDLVRVVMTQRSSAEEQLQLMEKVGAFALDKHPPELKA